MSSERSKSLYEKSSALLPGGVSSPVRAFKPYPRFIKSGKGSKIFDVDDNEYIDYCMAFGPLILGHSNEAIANAVTEQLSRGTLFGAPNKVPLESCSVTAFAIASFECPKIRGPNAMQ